MATHVTATELGRSLSEILSRVQFRGESFTIERNGDTIAVLRPATTGGPTWRDLAAALDGKLTRDGSFADDLEAVQREQPKAEAPDWPS